MKIKQVLPMLGLMTLISCGEKKVAKNDGIDFAAMDTTVRLQDDFYHYVNGSWIKNNPLKPAYSRYGTFDILRDSSQVQIRRIIDELISKEQKAGTNEYKIATLYKQAMDSVTRNKLGVEPIRQYLAEIEDIKDKDALLAYAAKENQEYGSGILFGSYVGADAKNSDMNILSLYQTGLMLGSKDYYLEDNETMKDIRSAYEQYLKDLFVLAKYSEAEAERIAKHTLKIETELAQISYSNTELRDSQRNYNMLKLADFAKENKGFDWQKYFDLRGLKVEKLNFGQLDFFKAFDKWYAKTDLREVKDWLLAGNLNGSASSLSDEFAEKRFEFFGKKLSGRKEMHPRWKRSLGVVSSFMGEALGKEYVKEHFSPEAKERMLTLVGNLQKALGERVKSLDWMSDETKAKALEKLSGFVVKIGYPDKWKDYSSMDIKAEHSYFDNLLSAIRFEQAEQMDKLGKPVDREKWLMNPQDVNAYYMPSTNEICFPAGILQPPFFNMNADDAVNYGAIGVVIGHEMTHGFDDQGANYDKEGNMNNWWTEDDLAKFRASGEKLIALYGRNEVAPGLMANGALTLGENIADQGGLLVSYMAMEMAQKGKKIENIEGLTPAQRFFIAYARLWGQNITKEAILQLTKGDPHSLGELRVNQALQNIKAFYKAFDIKEGDKLYLAPEERAVVW